jgi:hypothetical protein
MFIQPQIVAMPPATPSGHEIAGALQQDTLWFEDPVP